MKLTENAPAKGSARATANVTAKVRKVLRQLKFDILRHMRKTLINYLQRQLLRGTC